MMKAAPQPAAIATISSLGPLRGPLGTVALPVEVGGRLRVRGRASPRGEGMGGPRGGSGSPPLGIGPIGRSSPSVRRPPMPLGPRPAAVSRASCGLRRSARVVPFRNGAGPGWPH